MKGDHEGCEFCHEFRHEISRGCYWNILVYLIYMGMRVGIIYQPMNNDIMAMQTLGSKFQEFVDEAQAHDWSQAPADAKPSLPDLVDIYQNIYAHLAQPQLGRILPYLYFEFSSVTKH